MEGRTWGKDLERWFVRRVCDYAFSPMLNARLRYMRDSNRFVFGNPAPDSCGRCGNILDYAPFGCDACGLNHQTNGVVPLPGLVPFFQRVAHIILCLQLSQKVLTLRRLWDELILPVGYVRCKGCLTYCSTDLNFHHCYGRVNHEKATVVHCEQEWCSPRILGCVRCKMCGNNYCGSCVNTCDTCGQVGCCRKCARTYECQDEDSSSDEDCGDFCAVHAPPRIPFMRYNGDGTAAFVKLYCAKHYNGWRTHDEIRANCAICASPTDKGGGMDICVALDCRNCVCTHTPHWIEEGDRHCNDCRASKGKRVKH